VIFLSSALVNFTLDVNRGASRDLILFLSATKSQNRWKNAFKSPYQIPSSIFLVEEKWKEYF
jgi:hypothetical protein